MTACTNDENSLPNNNDVQNKEEGKEHTAQQLNCSALKDIKTSVFMGYSGYIFETNNGNIYELSTSLFRNNTNCKKLNDDNIKVEKRLSERNFLATNGFIYSISNDGKVSRSYNVDINDYEDVIMEKTFYFDNYRLKKDGKIYKYVNDNWELYKEIANEKILDFSIINNYNYEYIKTDKAFYSLSLINKEQCEKYNEIECEYKLIKNEKLTSAYNDIAVVIDNGGSYIDRNGKFYLTD